MRSADSGGGGQTGAEVQPARSSASSPDRNKGRDGASRMAVRDDAGSLRWDAYVARIARAAGALRRQGLAPGERFGILARNSVAQALLINSGYWGGMVPVPLNYRLAPTEITAAHRGR